MCMSVYSLYFPGYPDWHIAEKIILVFKLENFCVNLMILCWCMKWQNVWAIGSNLGATVEMGAQRHRGYLATGGTEGYTRGVQGPRYCGVHHGAEGYKVRPLPSSSFPQHKYTSIRDAATHTQVKTSIIHWQPHTLLRLQNEHIKNTFSPGSSVRARNPPSLHIFWYTLEH